MQNNVSLVVRFAPDPQEAERGFIENGVIAPPTYEKRFEFQSFNKGQRKVLVRAMQEGIVANGGHTPGVSSSDVYVNLMDGEDLFLSTPEEMNTDVVIQTVEKMMEQKGSSNVFYGYEGSDPTNYMSKSFSEARKCGNLLVVGARGNPRKTDVLTALAIENMENTPTIVMDTVGYLSEKLLETIPQAFHNRVMYLDISDKELVLPYNLFGVEEFSDPEWALMAACQRIRPEMIGPRSQVPLNMFSRLMIEVNKSLPLAQKFGIAETNNVINLSTQEINRLVDTIQDERKRREYAGYFKNTFHNLSPAFKEQVMMPLQQTLPVLTDDTLLCSFSSNGSFRMANIVEDKKILIINTSPVAVSDDVAVFARSIYGMLVGKLLDMHKDSAVNVVIDDAKRCGLNKKDAWDNAFFVSGCDYQDIMDDQISANSLLLVDLPLTVASQLPERQTFTIKRFELVEQLPKNKERLMDMRRDYLQPYATVLDGVISTMSERGNLSVSAALSGSTLGNINHQKEKEMWIKNFGSKHLKNCVEEGYDCSRLYHEERAGKEYPEFSLDYGRALTLKDRSCPSEESFEVIKKLKEVHKDTKDRFRVVWVTVPSNSSEKVIAAGLSDWREYRGEAILVEGPGYSNKHPLLLNVNKFHVDFG